MSNKITHKIAEEIKGLELADLLELKSVVERQIAVKALKTIDKETLNAIDGAEHMSEVKSLAVKADML